MVCLEITAGQGRSSEEVKLEQNMERVMGTRHELSEERLSRWREQHRQAARIHSEGPWSSKVNKGLWLLLPV